LNFEIFAASNPGLGLFLSKISGFFLPEKSFKKRIQGFILMQIWHQIPDPDTRSFCPKLKIN